MHCRRMTVLILAIVMAGCAEAGPDEAVPQIFLEGAVSSSDAHESLDYISASRDYFIFTRADLQFSTSAIYQGWNNNGVVTIEPVSFSGSGYDADAAISPKRDEVIFTSTRAVNPGAPENWNLWFARADMSEGRFSFSTPRLFASPVNSASSECCAVYVSETEFLFSSDRSGNWDIYRASQGDGGYAVEPLTGDVNSAHGEWPNQYLKEEGLLIFSSIRPTGKGGDDIYAAEKTSSGFGPPNLLQAPVNSSTYEDNALINEGVLFWSRRQAQSQSDIEQSDIVYIAIDAIAALKDGKE